MNHKLLTLFTSSMLLAATLGLFMIGNKTTDLKHNVESFIVRSKY